MKNLHTPPLPKNKNVMKIMVFFLFLLFFVVLMLVGDLIKKPQQEREMQNKLKSVEAELKAKQEKLDKTSWSEALGDNSDENKDERFSAQEKDLSSHTLKESEYLKERKWGFWYIVFPAFVIMGIFIFWVAKRHKKWLK